MRWIAGLLLGLLFVQVGGTAQKRVERIDFCELLNHPELYDRKEVTVRATHQYGFEWSTLYCLTCLDKGKAWLDFSEDMDDASRQALQSAPKGAGIINLTVTGSFDAGRGYGHMGAYRYKFVVRKAWDVAILVKGMKSREKESEVEKKWACGGTDPK